MEVHHEEDRKRCEPCNKKSFSYRGCFPHAPRTGILNSKPFNEHLYCGGAQEFCLEHGEIFPCNCNIGEGTQYNILPCSHSSSMVEPTLLRDWDMHHKHLGVHQKGE